MNRAVAYAGTRGLREGRARTRLQRLRAWVQPQVSIGVREQRDQAVLLLAVAVATLPHFDHLQLWSRIALVGMWVWRAALAQTLKPAPSRIVIVALLVLLTTSVWITHNYTLWGRDASVDFLLMLIGLKILEMRARRDVFIIVFLCLFVLETQFLFDQGAATAIFMLAAVLLLFYVLLSVSLPEGDVSVRGKLRYLARVFALAMPLTLTLFFLFPRLPAPMWSFASSQQQAGTGLSDSMKPGAIRGLLRDDSPALRAKFDGPVPPQRSLYWRGPVFGYLENDIWLPGEAAKAGAGDDPLGGSGSLGSLDIEPDLRSGVTYEVTLEPTQRREYLALDYAAFLAEEGQPMVPTIPGRLTDTLQVRSLSPVTALRRYRVKSYTAYALNAHASADGLVNWLQLPVGTNPRARQWADQIKARVQDSASASRPGTDGQRMVDAVLERFHASFRYSIQPGRTSGENGIDEFLFDTQIGYCEHYSSAFVFLMRAMGIPARVVTGYQGGEVNPLDGYLTVRQSDAHAWAEVWLAGRGWQRVDPTAAVAPERVERTLQDLRTDDSAAGRAVEPWLHRWRLDREALENIWNQWFLNYSAERQRALVGWIGLRPSTQNVALVAIGAFALLLFMLALGSLRRPTARDPLAELVFQLRQRLGRAGIRVPPSMGLQDLAGHLAGRLEAASLAEAQALLRDLGQARYAPASARLRKSDIQTLRTRLRRWRVVAAARPG